MMAPEQKSSVAVAIACYNHGRFLADAIGSVLAQSCPASEIIVVDDGSTDDTELVSRQHPAVTYIRQTNQGLSSARNTGLQHARSDYILFLDADDLLLPNAIADSRACLDANPEAAFVYGGYQLIDEGGKVLANLLPQLHRQNFVGLLGGNHIAMHATVLYRRTILLDAGGFDRSLRACEDYDVYLRLARRHPIAAYDSISTSYRRHGSNMTENPAHMLRWVKTVLLRHRPTPSDDPVLEKAWQAGWAFFEDYYGRELVKQIFRRFMWPATWGAGVRSISSALEVDDHFAWRCMSTVKGLLAAGARRIIP